MSWNPFGKGNNVVKDPVCGMDVDPGKTKLVTRYQGNNYYFCAPGCLAAFNTDPARYLGAAPAAMASQDSSNQSHHGGTDGGRKHGCC